MFLYNVSKIYLVFIKREFHDIIIRTIDMNKKTIEKNLLANTIEVVE